MNKDSMLNRANVLGIFILFFMATTAQVAPVGEAPWRVLCRTTPIAVKSA